MLQCGLRQSVRQNYPCLLMTQEKTTFKQISIEKIKNGQSFVSYFYQLTFPKVND